MPKKFLAITMCVFLMLAGSVTTSMAADVQPSQVHVQVDYSSAKLNADGSTTYDVVNSKQVAAFYGIDHPKKVTYTQLKEEKDAIILSNSSTFLSDVTGPHKACGSSEITRSDSVNNTSQTIISTIILTGSVSNTYSTHLDAGINLDVASISAGVGFDVTKTLQISTETQVNVLPGQIVTVHAYPNYDVYHYNVMKRSWLGHTENAGYGEASKCVGFCTVTE